MIKQTAHAVAAIAAAAKDQGTRIRHPDVPPLPIRTIKGMGWKKDNPAVRARQIALKHGIISSARAVIKVPQAIDLRETGFLPSVYDQSALGSCTSNAIAGVYEYEQKREGNPDFMPSRLFNYYGEREIENSIPYDAGAWIRDGMTVAAKLGFPPESLWPYNISRFTERPPAQAYTEALRHRSLVYSRVMTAGRERDVKLALAAQTPVVFGFTVYSSFFDVARDGIVKVPDIARENVEGGHAVVIVGYKRLKPRGAFYAIVRNSWGSSWGDEGYCYFPMMWLMNEMNADDFWVIQDVTDA
jgi:C1A family cysteine protease